VTVNLDGVVDMADFNVISDHMFQTANSRTDGDLTGDGTVNYDDFHFWKTGLLPASAVPARSEVPEPAILPPSDGGNSINSDLPVDDSPKSAAANSAIILTNNMLRRRKSLMVGGHAVASMLCVAMLSANWASR